MAEVEVGGVKFKGGKLVVIFTLISTLGGGLWAGFEFYKDYMDMREKIESYTAPDLDKRSRTLDSETRAALRQGEKTVRGIVANANERFDSKINSVTSAARSSEKNMRDITESATTRFDSKINGIDEKLTVFEKRLDKKLRDALNNPLLKR